MKQFLVAALFGSAGFVDAFAGTITGSVRGEPPAAPPEAAGSGAYESRRYKYVEKILTAEELARNEQLRQQAIANKLRREDRAKQRRADKLARRQAVEFQNR